MGTDGMKETGGTLLCIIAHPDDETLFAGGMLAMLAERGVEVHVLCATRGEGGSLGDPPLCTRDELGTVREAELRCAASTLGARSIEFLGYTDPVYTPERGLLAFEADPAEFEGLIVDAVGRLRPDVVITHGSDGEYAHPAHIRVHQTVLRAHRRIRSQSAAPVPALYTFSAAIAGQQRREFNDSDPAHIVIDVTSWLDVKSAALDCHRTQHAGFFIERPDIRTLRDFVWATESLHRVCAPEGVDPLMLAEWALSTQGD